MKMAKPLLVLPAIAILALELALVGVAVQPAQHTGFAQLYIYKNGKLIYYDPDDPPVNNFPILLISMLAGSQNNPYNAKKTDGSTFKDAEKTSSTGGSPHLYFIAYDFEYDPNMNQVPCGSSPCNNTHVAVDLNPDYTNNKLYITATFTYNDSTANITYYGVALVTDSINIMWFIDKFNTPITMHANDTITIEYILDFSA